MGVHHVEVAGLEELLQLFVRLPVLQRIEIAAQRRYCEDFQARRAGLLEETPFRAFGRAGHQGDFMPSLQVPLAGVEGVFLGAADNHPGDDVTDFQLARHSVPVVESPRRMRCPRKYEKRNSN